MLILNIQNVGTKCVCLSGKVTVKGGSWRLEDFEIQIHNKMLLFTNETLKAIFPK